MGARSFHHPLWAVALATAALLLIPLVAMQFSAEVSWSVGDFVVAAALLFTAGTAMVFGVRRTSSWAYRWGIVAAIAVVLSVVWAELAVGLFR
jgi:hypothetical protein